LHGIVARATVLADKRLPQVPTCPATWRWHFPLEFPTAISNRESRHYSDTTQYIGYFDSGEVAMSIVTTRRRRRAATSDTRQRSRVRWAPRLLAITRSVGGSFLNWATMQTIDPFRWALTGGYRSGG